MQENVSSKIPSFCKYRSTLCPLTLMFPSSFNLCLLWGLQSFTDSLSPQTILFILISCPNSLSSISSYISLASHPQLLLPLIISPKQVQLLAVPLHLFDISLINQDQISPPSCHLSCCFTSLIF